MTFSIYFVKIMGVFLFIADAGGCEKGLQTEICKPLKFTGAPGRI